MTTFDKTDDSVVVIVEDDVVDACVSMLMKQS